MQTTPTEVSFENLETAFAHKDKKDLKRTLWLFKMMNYPGLINWGTQFLQQTLRWSWVQSLVKKTLFQQFVGGENLSQCHQSVEALMDYGIYTYLAFSTEGKEADEEYDYTVEETIATIDFAAENKAIPFAVFKVTGLAPFDLLEKIQANETLEAEEIVAWEKVQERVLRICQRAQEKDVKIFFDAEESWIQDVIDELAIAMMKQFNIHKPIVYNTYQMYRKVGLSKLKEAFEDSRKGAYYFGVKLVRGAYMEKERRRAKEFGYSDPIHPFKEGTDLMYQEGLSFCLQNIQHLAVCLGTHNERSCYAITRLIQKFNLSLDHPHIFVAQLYGMSDHITYNMAQAGYNALKYVPYGPIEEVMPYLFRRAKENTSIQGQSNREYELVRKEVKRRQRKGE